MKITVITVCFNAINCITDTMQSVLGQTYSDIEYIVIDGGSNDGTAEIIRQTSDRLAYWCSEPDNGIYDAMNKGIAHSSGDYIVFMNAGDLFFNNSVVADVMTYIGTHSDRKPDFIYGETLVRVQSDRYQLRPMSAEPFINEIGCCHQSVFASGDIMRRERFDTSFRLCADFDFLHRARLDSNNIFVRVPKIIAIYDDTGVSSSWLSKRTVREERFRIIGKPFSLPACIMWIVRYYIKHTIFRAMPMKIEYKLRHMPLPAPLNSFTQLQ